MPIHVACPGCGKQLRVGDEHAGHNARCPACQAVFVVPHPQAGPATSFRPLPMQSPGEALVAGTQPVEKPSNVTVAGVLMLVGGIMSVVALMVILFNLLFAAIGTMGIACLCFLWPGIYIQIFAAVMGITSGVQLLGDRAHLQKAPTLTAVMQILCILNFDVINLALGIVELVLLNDGPAQRYFRR